MFVFFLLVVEKSNKSEKAANQGPQFTCGVIMKITDGKPLPGRKFIKVQYNSIIIIISIWLSNLKKNVKKLVFSLVGTQVNSVFCSYSHEFN